jgi:hypothetical protein
MIRRPILAALCGLALLATVPFASSADVSFSIGVAPPAPIIETVPPPPPAPGYVWTPGYWSWNGVTWVWVPRRYVVAPFPGAVWVTGRWARHGHDWMWEDGRWRRK